MKNDILYPVLVPAKRKSTTPVTILTDQSANLMASRIAELMTLTRPYLRCSYSLSQLGKDINFPVYQISHYLNQRLGVRFSDFINRMRIDHFKALVEQGVLRSTTLEGIAENCGFNNRNTLSLSLKKFTNMTPTDYIRHRS